MAEEEDSGSLEETAMVGALGFDFFVVRLPGAMGVGVMVAGVGTVVFIVVDCRVFARG